MEREKLFLEETSKKKNKWLSGVEVSEELQRLAAEIAAGSILVGGEKLPIGDSFSLVIKKQFKKGILSCEFSLHVPVGEFEEEQSSSQQMEEVKPQRYPSAGGKKLKRDINRLWKELVKHVNEKSTVPDELGRELEMMIEDYNLNANPQWAASWHACADKVKFCIAAAKKGDFGSARDTIDEIVQQTRTCHKLYK